MPLSWPTASRPRSAASSGDEQKQVKLTVFDLQTEPDRPGTSIPSDRQFQGPEFLVGAGQPRRAHHRPQDRRSLLLAYVGHHDDAYRWAERRRIETHPKTGALQIVEVRERVEEITTRPPAQQAFEFGAAGIEVPLAPATATPARQLFAELGQRRSPLGGRAGRLDR